MADRKWKDERERDLARRRESRLSRTVAIPLCKSKRRRNRLEKDDAKWLLWYFAPGSGCESPFTYEFTIQQREMINAIREAITGGDDQAIAASRGEGKTTLFERMLLKYTLQGITTFAVLFAATGQAAQDSLESIKGEIEANDRLCADYPEVCVPVRALENTPNRAHYQTVAGTRHDNGKPFANASSKFSWCGQEIYFPKVPGSPSAGAIIATRGLDSAVRGLKKKGRRPDVAGIDDPDTEETARSPEQAAKLEARIDKAIAGLGSQTHRVARIMLTTLQNRNCVSYRFTNPDDKPSWHGKRFRFLVTPPNRVDLWDEYTLFRATDWKEGTSRAHEFYVANRDAMDAGAEIANPNRYTHGELSALQHYYNEVARLGAEAVATEYDNDPPEEEEAKESGITAARIQARLSGYPRRVIPPECKWLSRGIDVKKEGLHWVVKAWRSDATNYVVDYGFFETHGTIYGSDEGVELAIRRAIIGCVEQSKDNPYCYLDSVALPIGATLVDSGWQTQAVYRACLEIGLGVFPAKGHGKSHGCATPRFSDSSEKTPTRRPGDGWFLTREVLFDGGKPVGKVWLAHCDTDRWKSYEHARWLTPEGKPGAAYLYGQVEEGEYTRGGRLPKQAKEHFSFAKHLTSEVETEDLVRGVLKRMWKVKTGRAQTHYLDASYLANVGGSMQGVRVLSGVAQHAGKKRVRPQSKVEEIGAR